ncbi:hypothetical protein ACLM5H_11460 [Fredinandcohnia humi]
MDLPTILSGPILRRVEPSHVYIWIALCKRLNIGGKLYRIDKNTKQETFSYHEIESQSETTTIRVGTRLYISLIKLTPVQQTFPTNILIGYNLFFKTSSGIQDLQDFNLLSPSNLNSIVYGNLAYPSFHIPEQNQTQILYGSCRKLHGKSKDALSQADKKIASAYLEIEKRPSALFLMGDQIYDGSK